MKRKNKYRLILIVLMVAISVGIVYAATVKYTYTGETVYMGTDGYDDQGQDDLAADEAYDYGANIANEANGYIGIWVFLEYDSSGTTDNIIIGLFGSFDGSTYDDVALWEVECDATSGADLQQSFSMFPIPPNFRLGVKTNDTNDTFDYQITYFLIRGDVT